MRKLNLGCGYVTPEDWENVDVIPYNNKVIEADVLKGLPYADEEFDLVYMNHTLQMFHYDQLPKVLDEVRRVMKQGAMLRILTPDMNLAIEAYRNGDLDYFPIDDEIESTLSAKFARYLFWHGDTRCAFDVVSLNDLLERNGFQQVHVGVYGSCELDSREEESLVMEAFK